MNRVNETTRRLLLCGVVAGSVYIIVGLAQILLRDGFDATRHPLSMMSLGEWGWVQIANFIVCGALTLLGAVGLYRAVRTNRAWAIGAILVGVFGIGTIGGGIFTTDPSLGFPPGTPDTYPETMSTSGLLHFIFGQLGFLALIVGSFFFARYFAVIKQSGWMWFSIFTGAFFLFSIFAGIVMMGSAWGMISLYLAVALCWVWLSMLCWRTIGVAPVEGRVVTA